MNSLYRRYVSWVDSIFAPANDKLLQQRVDLYVTHADALAQYSADLDRMMTFIRPLPYKFMRLLFKEYGSKPEKYLAIIGELKR